VNIEIKNQLTKSMIFINNEFENIQHQYFQKLPHWKSSKTYN